VVRKTITRNPFFDIYELPFYKLVNMKKVPKRLSRLIEIDTLVTRGRKAFYSGRLSEAQRYLRTALRVLRKLKGKVSEKDYDKISRSVTTMLKGIYTNEPYAFYRGYTYWKFGAGGLIKNAFKVL